MKHSSLILIVLMFCGSLYAQSDPKRDTAFNSVEMSADFPGGLDRFPAFVFNHIKTPELVSLFGFKGRVVISFVIMADGSISQVKPLTNNNLGLEEAICAVIQYSPKWKPGMQNGKNVAQNFAMPFRFNLSLDTVSIEELRKSSYSFVFQIKDQSYNIDQANAILGKKFLSEQIEKIEPYEGRFEGDRKKGIFLVRIKTY